MKKAYRCEDCGEEVVQEEGQKAPDCCGEVMKEIPMEACRDAGPEAARSASSDEPCEDFTGHQK